jgi:SAM-dependent methyltransferase
MHTSSIENMKIALSLIEINKRSNLNILDIGGRGLNGDRSYKSLFSIPILNYYIADIIPGENVTHVMLGEYELPFDDNSIDLIVSGQVLEHVKNPFRSVLEMKRVLKNGGHMILIAPSSGPRHDVRDCWRFMDDSFKAIAEECEIKLLHNWIDYNATAKDSFRWKDHVFVGQKII